MDPWSWQGRCDLVVRDYIIPASEMTLVKGHFVLFALENETSAKILKVILKIQILKDLVFFGDNRLRG